ncbi:MAG: hypothetical protein IJ295_01320, partial [Clostridia bacterium]|nr:hypothetical protein [Clostridia bacterium]
ETFLDLLFAPKQGYHTLDHVDIMGIKYAESEIKGKGIMTYNDYAVITKALLALLVDEKGNRLDLESAKKNFSRISFCTYCDGAFYLHHKIMPFLNQKMSMVGYSQSEIKAINNTVLNVSFAPNTIFNNKIPSVNVISLSDPVVKNHLDYLLTENQRNNLDGIYLYQDQPGFLYGQACENATASSIQIISSSLFNSYSGPFCEHNIGLTARDNHWQIRARNIQGVIHRPFNADCVSQMMAWALCKGVENSIQNFKSGKYVPNTYWQELKDDFKSIIHSYTPEQLNQNPVRKHALRKEDFALVSHAKQKKLTKLKQTVPSFEEMVNTLNYTKSFEEAVAYLKHNDFLGIEYVLPEVQVLTDAEKSVLLKMAGKKPEKTLQDVGLEK